MTSRIGFGAWVWLAACGLATAQTAVVELTLEQAVAEALARNPRILDAQDQIAQGALSVRVARSAFAPKATPMMQGSFGQSDLSNQTYGFGFSQRFTTGSEVRATMGATSAQNQLGTFYGSDTTLLITQPVLRGFGRDVATRGIAAADHRAAEAGRQHLLTEQRVAVEVAASFYGVIAQRQFLAIAQSAVTRSQGLLEAARAKLAAGRVSQLDVLRAEQLASQAEAQVLDAQTAFEDRLDDLRLMMHRGAEYGVQVRGGIPSTVDDTPLDVAIARAEQERLELRTAIDAVRDGELSVRLARNSALPQIDLGVGLTRRETAPVLSSSFGLDKFRLATFAGISLPLERTAQQAESQTAMMELERRRRSLESLRLSVAQEARHAHRRHDRARRALTLADSSVDFAKKEAELATLRHERGFSNNLDVVTAEGSLLAAEGRRIALLAELAVSRLELLAVMGALDPRRDVR